MRTAEQWREFLSDIKPENLPLSFKDWKGSFESYIADLAQQFAKNDIEIEEEVARLEALSPEEYAENFFRDKFDWMRERKRKGWTEYDEGYYGAMLLCAVCLGGFMNQDWLNIDGEEQRQ
jgi:hypothetical protein